MAEGVAKTRAEMIAKLKKGGINLPEKTGRKPATERGEKPAAVKEAKRQGRGKAEKAAAPKTKQGPGKGRKPFKSVKGEIIVVIFALYFGISMLSTYLYYTGSGIPLKDDITYLISIGISFAVAAYGTYRAYSKLTGSGFRFGRMLSFAKGSPESAKAGEFVKGVAGIILVFAIGISLIWLIFNWDALFKMGGEKVAVSGIEFVAPEGWEVDMYPAARFDVQVSGPYDGESRPNFLIGRHMILKTFDDEVKEARKTIISQGATIIDERSIDVAHSKAVEFTYRKYNEDEKCYKKGKSIFMDLGFGDSLTIMFVSKEEGYENNLYLFNRSLSTLVINPPE